MKRIVVSALCLKTLCPFSNALELAPDSKAYWNKLYQSVVNAYEFDQVLVNGICYEDVYRLFSILQCSKRES